MTHKLVLLRHGQSEWNLSNQFTGWVDVDLTERGIHEAHEAARLLVEAGFEFDVAYTSVLRRAIRTLWLVMDDMDQMWIPVHRLWRLNERHYGALQGLNKAETAARHGDEQVHIWRRSYDVRPPELPEDDEMHPRFDKRYAAIEPALLPSSECLKDTLDRVMPVWNETIAPTIRAGVRTIIVAHGNSLRALVKHLSQISDEEITQFNIPTGIPLVYELDGDLNATSRYFLGDADSVRAAAEAVANQASTGR